MKNGNYKEKNGYKYNKNGGAKRGARQNERFFEEKRAPKKTPVKINPEVSEATEREDIVYGRNPVFELLESGRGIEKIYVQSGERTGSIVKLVAVARAKSVIVVEADRKKLDELAAGGLHQGVVAVAAMKEYCEVADILAAAKEKDEKPFIIICENITDPHNLGAIIRTACCAGAHGVIIPKRGGVGVTSTVYKTSAGAAEYMPVAKVNSISNAIGELKANGVWIYGTDASGEQNYTECDLNGSIALVIGSEGEGMKKHTVSQCDFLVKIPLKGKINSLNASAAAAVMIYEALRQRDAK